MTTLTNWWRAIVGPTSMSRVAPSSGSLLPVRL
jgi:hypothetical protein